MENAQNDMAHYHLPGLFEFYELYRVFLVAVFAVKEKRPLGAKGQKK